MNTCSNAGFPRRLGGEWVSVGFNSGGRTWVELEQALSGQVGAPAGDGGDSPAWSRRREGYAGPPPDLAGRYMSDDLCGGGVRVPYAELHVHSNFSFLDGVSQPEALVEEAARAGLDAIALTDHDGMYGVVRFAEAARELGMRTVFGAELSLDLPGPQNGVRDPVGQHLLVLARELEGYRRLCRVISNAHLRGGEKGRPVYDLDEVVEELRGHAVVLSGCRKGAVRRALVASGPDAAYAEVFRLREWFGRDHVAVELIDHQLPLDSRHNDVLFEIGRELRVPVLASNNVHYAQPGQGRLAAAVAAVRARSDVEDMDGWQPPAPLAFLRTGEELARIFGRYGNVVQQAATIGLDCSFDLTLVAPDLPPFPVPDGHTEVTYLRRLTWEGAARRYGPREENPKAHAQLDHELRIIEALNFPGYFLVVWDIVDFCRRNDIYAQGRGSAANSAVCYALGITNADPVKWNLLFERFLAPERDGPPDIDVDIESDRREEAIQYVYAKHGRRHAAQVANVITYRARSAVRDMAKALGYSPGQQAAWARQIDRWGPVAKAEPGEEHPIPQDVLAFAAQIGDPPRHLGIHSGGMVICDRPVAEVVPVEHARMKDRTVLQWDKDDCAAIGLVKFDLLGLGMLSAIHYTVDLVREHEGDEVDIARLDLADPAVYDMLCAADAVGVFQVESRAQLATLPRLRPREFYDLVVEVALIRPGPIQGGSVHPYIRRRGGAPWECRCSMNRSCRWPSTSPTSPPPRPTNSAEPWAPSAPAPRWHAYAPGSTTARPRTGSPETWPKPSTARSRRSPATASPRHTACPSPCSSTPARTSSSTTPPPSAPASFAPNPWASTPPSPSSPTPAATAWRSCARTSTAASPTPHWNPTRPAPATWPSAWTWAPSADWAPRPPRPSSTNATPTARTGTWRTWAAAPNSPNPNSKPWPPRARSTPSASPVAKPGRR